MTSTPRTFQAVLKSKRVMMTDSVAIECARLETEVAGLVSQRRRNLWQIGSASALCAVLAFALAISKRDRMNDRQRWLEMTDTLSDIARDEGVMAGYLGAKLGRKPEDVSAISDALKNGKAWQSAGDTWGRIEMASRRWSNIGFAPFPAGPTNERPIFTKSTNVPGAWVFIPAGRDPTVKSNDLSDLDQLEDDGPIEVLRPNAEHLDTTTPPAMRTNDNAQPITP